METTCCRNRIGILAVTAWLVAAMYGAARAQETTRVSVATGGAQGNNTSSFADISADGRYVAFESAASNLVPGDTNNYPDIFVRDRVAGSTERVSLSAGGGQANQGADDSSISADGRFVAFGSWSTNLVPGLAPDIHDIFVRDRQAGTTELVSLSTGGAHANSNSFRPRVSADGRYVTFESAASNLVPGDTNGTWDVFVRDRQTGSTERVSLSAGGVQGNGGSWWCRISADGRFVTWHSEATDLVPGDTNGTEDIFLRDRLIGTTERVSVASGGGEANARSAAASISADGRYVAFESEASNLVPGDTNNTWDIFLRDRQTGTTERMSVSSGGGEANGPSERSFISADGRYVAFSSAADNLVPGDTNGTWDVFVRDRVVGTTERVSVATGGTQGNAQSLMPSISGDGRSVAFWSLASNLVPGDTNGTFDVFVRDRGATFTTLCAGDGSGAPCGCGNEAAPGSGGGCANGAPMPAGQGAVLSASGSASVAADDLVLTVDFTTEQPGLFFQGHNAVNGGAGQTFGDGLRCCGGSVVRLEIVDPPGPAGAHTVGSTLPILGTSPPGTTLPGDSRCYQWWYRNPGVSPCGSNFNLSNAVLVTWEP